MTTWRVSTATPQSGMYWIGTAGKPELIGVSILPCDETRQPYARVRAILAALNDFDAMPGGSGCGDRRGENAEAAAFESWSP